MWSHDTDANKSLSFQTWNQPVCIVERRRDTRDTPDVPALKPKCMRLVLDVCAEALRPELKFPIDNGLCFSLSLSSEPANKRPHLRPVSQRMCASVGTQNPDLKPHAWGNEARRHCPLIRAIEMYICIYMFGRMYIVCIVGTLYIYICISYGFRVRAYVSNV